jgi:TetR/AcrR family transcriptional regulator
MTLRKPTDVRRIEIADGALNIVATRGIAALSTRALAESVGLTTGALFKHFPSLDALYVGMAERVSDLLDATYPQDSLPPRERLLGLADARLDLVSGRAGVLTLVLSEQFALALPDGAVRVLREAIGQTRIFVARAIQEGQEDGSIRSDVSADSLALLFMGAMQMTALARRTGTLGGATTAVEALDVLIRPTHTPERP